MRLKAFVLIESENKFLLIQEAGEKWRGKWYFPGGSVKDHETLEAGAAREVMEEAGCQVELTSVFFVKYHPGFFNRKVTVYYCGKIVGSHMKDLADEESLAVKWFSYEEIKTLTLRKNLLELITIYQQHKNFIPAADFRLNED